MRPGRLLYGKLLRRGETLDEVILDCVRLKPQPLFTINAHGGALASVRIMEALAAEGAVCCTAEDRIAAMRTAGDIHAIQAEGLEAISRAMTLKAVSCLLDQQGGALAAEVARLRAAAQNGNWDAAVRIVERLLATARFGRALTAPPRVALAGRPNAGKSTLANALLRCDRMIVHHMPGTTRDMVEEPVSIGGWPFLLADAAGVRATEDSVEREGVERALASLRNADIALLLFDGSAALCDADSQLVASALPARIIPVLNKCDLPRVLRAEDIRRVLGCAPVEISASRGDGLEELEARIVGVMWPELPPRGAAVIFTSRQEILMRTAQQAAAARNNLRLNAVLDDLIG